MFAQRYLAKLVFATIAFSSIPCLAMQSSSRGSAPVGSGTRGAAQSFSSPIQSAPAQQFSSPQPIGNGQTFSSPQTFSAPQQFSAPSAAGSSSSGSSSQGFGPAQANSVQQPASNGGGALGIPQASLVDPIFQISDAHSPYIVDHSAWDGFLAQYLVTDSIGLNRIRYRQISRADREVLQNYLIQMQSTDIRALNRDEQLAFWVNLYNARTVALVNDNYPVRSIRQIKQKPTDFMGPFDDEGAVQVLGKSLSLNDIESGIIRPSWNDPRIHYALNCASYGCPNLASTAWTSDNLDSRLNAAAYEFVNSGRAVKRGLFGLRVSKIYKWYGDDFGGSDQAILNHISQYANDATLNIIGGRQKIRGYFYDWSLSDARFSRPRILESLRR